MPNYYTPQQLNALNSLSPNVKASGINLGDELDSIRTNLASGNLGIKSDAFDVDSLAFGGGAFSRDTDAGLTMGYKAGQIWIFGVGFVNVAAGSIALSANATNYVEVSAAGAVSKNTVGFTVGRTPLYIAVTSGTGITSATPAKPLLQNYPVGGYPGAVLSVPAKTKTVTLLLPTLSATTPFLIKAPSAAATLVKQTLIVGTTVAADNANYWTATTTNLGAAGSGTTAMLSGGTVNTTQVAGGALTAAVVRAFALSGTTANLNTVADDVLQIVLTRTGTPTNISGATMQLEFTSDL